MRVTKLLARVSLVTGPALWALLLAAPGARAQLEIDPTAEPTLNTGGWVYAMAILITTIGVLVTLALIAGYLRFSRSFRREQAASAPKVVRATPVFDEYEPVRQPVMAAAPAAEAPAPAAPAAPAAASAPPQAQPAPAAPAAASAQAPAAAPAAQPQQPAAPAPEVPHVEVELDQEVFEQKLAELLEKGTDRRVAEGQARRAAMIAARKSAAGG